MQNQTIAMVVMVVLFASFGSGVWWGDHVAQKQIDADYYGDVLATRPGIDPQVCYIAKVHKDHPAFDCSSKKPIDVEVGVPPDNLTKNAIYTGSLTLAGVALFGGILLGVPFIRKSDPTPHRITAAMAIGGPFALAGTHIWFATSMCCDDPNKWIQEIGVLTAIFAGIGVLGYVWLITPRRSSSKEPE